MVIAMSQKKRFAVRFTPPHLLLAAVLSVVPFAITIHYKGTQSLSTLVPQQVSAKDCDIMTWKPYYAELFTPKRIIVTAIAEWLSWYPSELFSQLGMAYPLSVIRSPGSSTMPMEYWTYKNGHIWLDIALTFLAWYALLLPVFFLRRILLRYEKDHRIRIGVKDV